MRIWFAANRTHRFSTSKINEMRLNFSCLVLILLAVAFGKPAHTQVAVYTFDAGSFDDQMGNFGPMTANSLPGNDCGLIDDGVYLNGMTNMTFPREIDSLMEEDFALSFYFRIDNAVDRTDIFAHRSACSLDSFLSITFNPVDSTIHLDLAQTISSVKSEKAKLNLNKCWHHLVLTKEGLFYDVYLDDIHAIRVHADGVVKFSKNARMTIANSPCIAVNEDRFVGWIDDISFYDNALSGLEIKSISYHPDEILTPDTTIIGNSTVDILTGKTCATDFSWSPTQGLDDPGSLNPLASPEATTTYYIQYHYTGGCVTEDSITIYVVDPQNLECQNLLIPNAFTPNGDNLNDRYGISGLFMVEAMDYFDIYDRWGSKIWSAASPQDTWDGLFQGKSVNPGMYLYKIKYTCSGKKYVKVGNFSVLR